MADKPARDVNVNAVPQNLEAVSFGLYTFG